MCPAIVLLSHNNSPFMESPSCEGQTKFLKRLERGRKQEVAVEVTGRKIFIVFNKKLFNNSSNCLTTLGMSGKTAKKLKWQKKKKITRCLWHATLCPMPLSGLSDFIKVCAFDGLVAFLQFCKL